MKKGFYLLAVLFFCISCKSESTKKTATQTNTASTIKYAKGFDILNENGKKYLLLKKVFPNSTKQFKYLLSNSNNLQKKQLKVPVERLVVTSTTHIPMIELLQGENTLVGFPNTKFISSPKTRALVDNKTITELGSEQNINTEILIDLKPDLVIGFSLNPNNKLFNNIQKIGIPVIFNGDWLEETPLGRAEWIKVFGVLLGKEKEAAKVFKTIEANYLNAKEIAQKATHSPKILSGSMFKDVWYVPAGESFMAQYFSDANLDYIWKDTKGTGSLQLSFESVLDKGQKADYWLGCGLNTTKEELLKTNTQYKTFTPFKADKIYTLSAIKGPTGGIEYFEFAPIRPDLVLKDLIKITQPELLKDYQLRFFSLVK